MLQSQDKEGAAYPQATWLDKAGNPKESMDLYNLLINSGLPAAKEQKGIIVSLITADSRQVIEGALFVAVRGENADGHDFVATAIARGAVAVIVEAAPGRKADLKEAQVLKVPESREALAKLAAAFYGHPEQNFTLVGITGTNGKTTTSYIIEEIIARAGGRPGVIGTVNYRYPGKTMDATFTTPEPVALFKVMREMADAGVTHLIMEVSSHALSQKRLFGLKFDVAVFTNLSRDHLDFHGHMEEYFVAKKELFLSYLKPAGRAVIVDFCCLKNEAVESADEWGRRLVNDLRKHHQTQDKRQTKKISISGVPGDRVIICGDGTGTVYADNFGYDLSGLRASIVLPSDRIMVNTPLTGRFNLKNILTAAGAGLALGIKGEVIAAGIDSVRGVPGRLEPVETLESQERDIKIFVDYAHTPDALENVLKTVRDLRPRRLVVIFGCGGDRDRGKRPQMGAVAVRLADVVVVTSDNPRSEEPTAILRDIEQGITAQYETARGHNLAPGYRSRLAVLMCHGRNGYDIIESRKEAISETLRFAKAGDAIVISGKGHECYQISKGRKSFFDDRLEAVKALTVIDW